MASNPDSYKNRYSYIPPSVQKAMDTHMQRDMPANLQKYQQSGFVPAHAEKALSDHLKKNLPGHLQQYADAYMQQNVVWANNPEHINAPTSVPQSSARPEFMHDAHGNKDLHYNSQDPQQNGSVPSFGGASGSPDGEYDFIMNPGKPPQRGFTLPGNSKTQRAIIVAVGVIVLIMLFSFTSSFFNKESNAQKDRLLKLAQTQYEIVRVANEANRKISDKNLLYKSSTVQASVESSQNEIISALKNRGKKVKTKQINLKNPQDDATLKQGDQNGRYDQTYSQLLNKQLADYQSELQAVYNSGNKTEKNIALSANNQIKLILGDNTD